MTVEADGFKRAIRSGITLELRQTARIDVELEVGQLTESVSVTADAPLLTTTEAAQGEVINNKQIVDFPLNGRDYLKLTLLTAGAIQSNTGRRNSFSSSGMRPSQNNIMLDGIDNGVDRNLDRFRTPAVETNAFSAWLGADSCSSAASAITPASRASGKRPASRRSAAGRPRNLQLGLKFIF